MHYMILSHQYIFARWGLMNQQTQGFSELLRLPGKATERNARPTFFSNTRVGFLSEAALLPGTSAYHLAAVYTDGFGETSARFLYRVGDVVSKSDIHHPIDEVVPASERSRRGPYELPLIAIILVSPTEEGHELLILRREGYAPKAH
jgi:hypothetical protein